MLKKILPLLAWRGWGIIRYNSIWQNFSALFFIALTRWLYDLAFVEKALDFLLFSTVMTAFGYLVNDLADVELDRQHQKPNAFEGTGRGKAIILVLLVLAIGLVLALPFLSQPWFIAFWLLWIFLGTSYSLRPLRLKERGGLGLIATVAAQQTLPVAMLFAAFGQPLGLEGLVFILYATIRGISSDVSHQMRDWPNDSSTRTRTFAVQHGYRLVQFCYMISLETERLILGTVILLFLLRLPPLSLVSFDWRISPGWILVFFYIPFLSVTIGRSWSAWRQGVLTQNDPYDETRQARVHDALHVIHHSFPSVIIPLYLALIATFFFWPNVIFLVILILVYGIYSPRRWAATWPLRPLLSWLRTVRV